MIIAAGGLDLDCVLRHTEQRPLLYRGDVRSSQVERVFLIGFGLRYFISYTATRHVQITDTLRRGVDMRHRKTCLNT